MVNMTCFPLQGSGKGAANTQGAIWHHCQLDLDLIATGLQFSIQILEHNIPCVWHSSIGNKKHGITSVPSPVISLSGAQLLLEPVRPTNAFCARFGGLKVDLGKTYQRAKQAKYNARW